MHLARRDRVRQSPASDGRTRGTFTLRSPLRPNPIDASIVRLEGVEGTTLLVRGLDCVDGTPLLDVKPERCLNLAPPDGAGSSSDRKSTRLNSSHYCAPRMPASARKKKKY